MKNESTHTPGLPGNRADGPPDDGSRASSSPPPAPISYPQALVFLDQMAELYTVLLEAEEARETPREDRVNWLRAATADMEQKLRTLKPRDAQQFEEIAETHRQLCQMQAQASADMVATATATATPAVRRA